jgi:tetratricopeptide (TPR) repeat protein
MRFGPRHTTSRPAARRGLERFFGPRGGAAAGLLLGLWVAGCAIPSAAERARSLSRQGHDEQAVELLKSDIAAHPDDVSARRLLVRLLGVTGDLPGARAQAEELARQKGASDPTAYIELGHAFELAHRYEDALAAYDEAATVAPTSAAGPREGGMRSARWGEVEEARPRLEEAVRRGAVDAETWHALGLVRLHLGDFEGATQAYRAGAAADPRAADCWLGLATVGITRGDPTLALEAYDQVLARRPHFGPAALGRAWALGKLGRKDEALRALDQAQDLGAPAANVARLRASLEAGASTPAPASDQYGEDPGAAGVKE